jgi:DNA mismatch repair protein MutH
MVVMTVQTQKRKVPWMGVRGCQRELKKVAERDLQHEVVCDENNDQEKETRSDWYFLSPPAPKKKKTPM